MEKSKNKTLKSLTFFNQIQTRSNKEKQEILQLLTLLKKSFTLSRFFLFSKYFFLILNNCSFVFLCIKKLLNFLYFFQKQKNLLISHPRTKTLEFIYFFSLSYIFNTRDYGSMDFLFIHSTVINDFLIYINFIKFFFK